MKKPAAAPIPVAPTFVQFCERIGLALTPLQRLLAGVAFDHEPVPDTPEALEMFGFTGPVPVGAHRVIAALLGRNSGKSRLSGAYILFRACHATLPKLGKGEVAFAAIVAPNKDLAGQALRFARGMLQDTKYERAITAETADSFTLTRPTGETVRIQVFAADRGGTALRGRYYCAAVLDEAAFFRSAGSAAIVNDADIFKAITPRLHGAVVLCSTPWVPGSLMHTYCTTQYGKPSTALVAIGRTEAMRPDDPDLLARIEAEFTRDPDSADREYNCQWLATGSGGAFDPAGLERSLTDEPLREDGTLAIAGDIGISSDPSAFVMARIHGDGSVSVVDVREYRPRKDQPIHVASMMRDVAAWAEKYGASSVIKVDHHSLAEVQQIIERDGIPLRLEPVSEGADRERRFRYTADLFAAGKVRIPREHARLTEQLSLIVSTPRDGGGYTFTAPRRSGHHCDLAMSFVLVCDGALGIETFAGAMRNADGLAAINEAMGGWGEVPRTPTERWALAQKLQALEEEAVRDAIEGKLTSDYEAKRDREDPTCQCGSRHSTHNIQTGVILPFVAMAQGIAPCGGFRPVG